MTPIKRWTRSSQREFRVSKPCAQVAPPGNGFSETHFLGRGAAESYTARHGPFTRRLPASARVDQELPNSAANERSGSKRTHT